MTIQAIASPAQALAAGDDAASGSDTEPDSTVAIRRAGQMLRAALRRRCIRLLPIDWRMVSWKPEPIGTVIDSIGSVDIRRVPRGCFAQTSVKGDIGLARGTALLRLEKYVTGDNRSERALEAERPVLQQCRAPGLWRVAVRLSGIGSIAQAPMPRSRRVTLTQQEASTWAVVTRKGCPSERAIERAEIAIMDAIARTRWFAMGPATVRIHSPSILPFAGAFEVAVPVSRQAQRSGPNVVRPAANNRPANSPGLAVR